MLKPKCKIEGSKLRLSQSFKKLPNSVISRGIHKYYRAGMVLREQQDDIKFIALVQSGQALALSFDGLGKENWITTYGSGQFIDASSLYDDHHSNYRILAKTNMDVLYFKKALFLDLVQENREFADYVMKDLVAQLKHFSSVTIKSQSLSKRGLIASEFKSLAQPKEEGSESYVISPAPVVTEIALKLGVARETVSRTVSSLIKNNVLQRQTDAFIVPDLTRLEAQVI